LGEVGFLEQQLRFTLAEQLGDRVVQRVTALEDALVGLGQRRPLAVLLAELVGGQFADETSLEFAEAPDRKLADQRLKPLEIGLVGVGTHVGKVNLGTHSVNTVEKSTLFM